MTKFILVATGVTVIGALSALIHVQSNKPARHSTDNQDRHFVVATGRIEGLTKEVEFRPEITGRVAEILVAEGEEVASGQVLLRIDNKQYLYELALANAELNLAEAQLQRLVNGARKEERVEANAKYLARRAQLEQAQIELRRIEELWQNQAVSAQDHDDKRLTVVSLQADVEGMKARADLVNSEARDDEVKMADARVSAARAKLELANVELQRTEMKSPIKGKILQVNPRQGDLIGPDSPGSVIRITDSSRFRVRAFIEELHAPLIRVGMKALVHIDAWPGREFEGRVASLSPRMGNKSVYSDAPGERIDTKTREAWIDLDDDIELIVGLRVDITIVTQSESEQDVTNNEAETGSDTFVRRLSFNGDSIPDDTSFAKAE